MEQQSIERTTVLKQANELVVKVPADRKTAADLWDAIRAFRKQEESNKEAVCRPLKRAWEDAKVPYDTFIHECEGYERKLQGLMNAWDQEQDRLARVEQARVQALIDKANQKIVTKAEEKGIEPVLKVAPVVQAPPKRIETQAGTTQQRSEKTVYGIKECLDAVVRGDNPKVAALLAAFPGLFALDWVAFRKVAAAGLLDAIPCVEKRTEYVYSQRKA